MRADEQTMFLAAFLGLWAFLVWFIVRLNRRTREDLQSDKHDPPLRGIWPSVVKARYEDMSPGARQRFWKRYNSTVSFVIWPLAIAGAVFGLVYQSIPAVIAIGLSILVAIAFAVSGR